jgi:uncharacterized protein (TIRG00374 family)
MLDALVLSHLLRGVFKSFKGYFFLTMRSQFYGSITPFNSGGQPSQVLRLSRENVPAGVAISGLAQKFFIYQLCTVTISSLSIFFKSGQFKSKIPGFTFLIVFGLLMQCFGLISIVLFYLNKEKVMKIIFWGSRLLAKIKLIKNPEKINKKIVDQLTFLMENSFSINCGNMVYVYSFFQNIMLYSVPFFIAKSFELQEFPIFDMIAAQAFITLISCANPLPGAAGTTEGSFLLILTNFFSRRNLTPAMILCRLINYYLNIICGFLSTIFDKNLDKNQ